MYVNELAANYAAYGLPKRFVDVLPSVCPSCGEPMEIRESLTGLGCSNPRCPDRILMRIKSICNQLGILQFGESTIEKFIEYYDVTCPLEIFGLQEGMVVAEDVSPKISESIISQIAKKKDFLLWEYVQIANLPYIQTSAKAIFEGYETLKEAYEDIEDGRVDFIQSRLGISCEGSVSIKAIRIYETLMEFKDDLIACIGFVNIKSMAGKIELNVVCSNQVGGGFGKKSEFYDYVNSTFGDRYQVNFLSSVNKKIDYLVWAGADGSPSRYTNKVKTVEGYNSKGTNIPIVTANQFINILGE